VLAWLPLNDVKPITIWEVEVINHVPGPSPDTSHYSSFRQSPIDGQLQPKIRNRDAGKVHSFFTDSSDIVDEMIVQDNLDSKGDNIRRRRRGGRILTVGAASKNFVEAQQQQQKEKRAGQVNKEGGRASQHLGLRRMGRAEEQGRI
jgi:predicted transcriptional regulator